MTKKDKKKEDFFVELKQVLMAMMYKGFKEDYVKNHGTDEGYFEKFFLWTIGIFLAVTIAHVSVIPHIICLILFLSYYAYKGYKEVGQHK